MKPPSAECPLGSWVCESSQREARLSNSPQLYFSYQAGYRVVRELVFLKTILSPMNVEDRHAERRKEQCRHFFFGSSLRLML